MINLEAAATASKHAAPLSIGNHSLRTSHVISQEVTLWFRTIIQQLKTKIYKIKESNVNIKLQS